MSLIKVNSPAAKLVLFGSLFTCLVVFINVGTDPVNAPKLLLLGGFGGGALALLLFSNIPELWINFKPAIFFALLFLVASLNAIIFSDSPFEQNFFGAYGRQTGFLTYFFLTIILCVTFLLNSRIHLGYVLKGLLIAGFINVLYCSWVLAFGDFIGWNNTYNNLLGLFGNPDYISAFLGICIGVSVIYFIDLTLRLQFKIAIAVVDSIALFCLYKTHSLQGALVLIAEVITGSFLYLVIKYQNKILNLSYGLFAIIFFALTTFGIFQKGPLSFLYKKSVSLRGTYWKTGIRMGIENPWHGVGFDAYGDWYRTLRPPIALIDTPGPQTLSNASHNVLIDIFASGGFPLLLSYLGLLILGVRSIFRTTKRLREFDITFAGLSVAWLGYQLQSIVSINQIGLAIWGWLLTGALISYEYVTRKAPDVKSKSTNPRNSQIKESVVSGGLIAGIGCVLGMLIALPPLNSDAKWFSALKSHSANEVETSLSVTPFNPPDSMRYAEAINIFQSSGLHSLARKYVFVSLGYNPRSFIAWKQLYFLTDASESEKNLAISKMKSLDPLNPNVLSN